MGASSEPVGLSPTEQAFLRALQSHDVPFMLVGIAAARLQGAPVVTEDIDLWFARGSQEKIAAAAEETNGPPIGKRTELSCPLSKQHSLRCRRTRRLQTARGRPYSPTAPSPAHRKSISNRTRSGSNLVG